MEYATWKTIWVYSVVGITMFMPFGGIGFPNSETYPLSQSQISHQDWSSFATTTSSHRENSNSLGSELVKALHVYSQPPTLTGAKT